jgi:hypothetical protein
MEARGRIKIDGPDGMDRPGSIILEKDNVELRSESGTVKVVSLRDIVKVDAIDHQIYLETLLEGSIVLSMLGNRYDDLLRELHRSRNELSLRDRLMQESVRRPGVRCQCRIAGAMSTGYQGKAEVRLYSTALVIMPENDHVRRVPYSDILNTSSADETLSFQTERGCSVLLSQLGRELGPLHRDINAAVHEISSAVQSLLKQLCPTLSPSQLASASRLMAEGKAARRGDVEAVSKELWNALQLRIEGMGLGEEYAYLDSICEKGSVRVGIKRGLGEEGSDYLWVMAPVIGNPKGGNAIVFEATSEEGEGRATYVFRILPAKDLYSLPIDDIPSTTERSTLEVGAALMAINFRREPIYLSESELTVPGREAYQNAVRAMPELRLLRRSFAGRVIHSSMEQWKEDITKLLAFCARSDDGQVWTPPPE